MPGEQGVGMILTDDASSIIEDYPVFRFSSGQWC
jgi:hypothetical protein